MKSHKCDGKAPGLRKYSLYLRGMFNPYRNISDFQLSRVWPNKQHMPISERRESSELHQLHTLGAKIPWLRVFSGVLGSCNTTRCRPPMAMLLHKSTEINASQDRDTRYRVSRLSPTQPHLSYRRLIPWCGSRLEFLTRGFTKYYSELCSTVQYRAVPVR